MLHKLLKKSWYFPWGIPKFAWDSSYLCNSCAASSSQRAPFFGVTVHCIGDCGAGVGFFLLIRIYSTMLKNIIIYRDIRMRLMLFLMHLAVYT